MKAWRAQFGQRPIQAPAGWLLLALGVVCVAFGLRAHLHASAEHSAATTARFQSIDEARRLATRQQLANVDEVPAYLHDKRWHRAAVELDAPWLLTLSALEQATKPPIFLTGIRSDPASGRVQIDAEAPSLDDVLAYVQTLHKATPLRDVWLLRHEEVPDASTGRSIVRFAVQATWVKAP
jgi:hypothetical protein